MSEPVIIFDSVSKSYPLYHHITGGIKNFLFHFPRAVSQLKNHRYEALKGISFQVNRGESFGIIGKNGAGKSTALGLIAGVIKPSGGTIVVKGRVSPLLELGSGFNGELTGKENIMLNGVLMGLTRAEVLRKMEEIIEFSGLGDFIDQPLRTYSSGMIMRLGFSVVASLDPEILLIDEVLAVGDMEFQKKCMDKMKGFKENGVTIVFVSHGLNDVLAICDRVVWIENHQVRMMGSAEEVVNSYANP
ncbi:MAG TPA: ABC transporter ATP-binding protein, partial [Dissulfurispiraceae bacterium]|nr:ABC transporter ATP-binding protein [Dissulfurispiraceae bacterium]